MANDNDMLEGLAELARDTYIAERRSFERLRTGVPSHYEPSAQWDGNRGGKRDRYGRNVKPVWPDIVQYALRHGVAVDELIRARFATWVGRQAPNPSDCKTDAAVMVVQKRSEALGQTVQSALATERTVAQTELFFRSAYVEKYGWKPEDVVESLIADVTVGLSPLFRVILAGENGRPDLADQFHQAAVEQYHRARRFYDASEWGRLIPTDVRVGADQLSAYATGGR